MLIWGGTSRTGYLNTGGSYAPKTHAWQPMSTDGAPAERAGHTAIWTGEEMLIWGGTSRKGHLNTGGSYSPKTDAWKSLETQQAP